MKEKYSWHSQLTDFHRAGKNDQFQDRTYLHNEYKWQMSYKLSSHDGLKRMTYRYQIPSKNRFRRLSKYQHQYRQGIQECHHYKAGILKHHPSNIGNYKLHILRNHLLDRFHSLIKCIQHIHLHLSNSLLHIQCKHLYLDKKYSLHQMIDKECRYYCLLYQGNSHSNIQDILHLCHKLYIQGDYHHSVYIRFISFLNSIL